MLAPNDWKLDKFILSCAIIFLSFVVLILLSIKGFNLSYILQIVGFIFLTFIPGYILLRILKIHDIGIGRSIIFAADLSIILIIFIGLLANIVMRVLGLESLSIYPMMSLILIFVAFLGFASYKIDSSYRPLSGEWSSTSFKDTLLPALFIIFVGVFGLLGIFLAKFYSFVYVLIISLIILSLFPILLSLNKLRTPLYPLLIYITSILLIYQFTLMFAYISNDPVKISHIYLWNSSLSSNMNGSLNNTILEPIYSLILQVSNINLRYIYYPFIFSLVPLSVYYLYTNYVSNIKACLSVIFFMAVPAFSAVMYTSSRDQIAELFFVSALLCLFEKRMWHEIHGIPLNWLIGSIFLMMIPLCTYGYGLLTIFYLIVLLIFILIYLGGRFLKFQKLKNYRNILPLKASITIIALCLTWSFLWYSLNGSGSVVQSLWLIANKIIHISAIIQISLMYPISQYIAVATNPWIYDVFSNASNFLSELTRSRGGLGPIVQTALGLDFLQASTAGRIFRILQIITEIFLISGFMKIILRPREMNFPIEYIGLSFAAFLSLVLSIALPPFGALGMGRLYQFALIMLSPMFILGGELILSSMFRIAIPLKTRDLQRFSLLIISACVLSPYFLFTSGVIYELNKENATNEYEIPISFALSNYRTDMGSNPTWREIAASKWINHFVPKDLDVLADFSGKDMLSVSNDNIKEMNFNIDLKSADKGYVFLRERNIFNRELNNRMYMWSGLIWRSKLDDFPYLNHVINSSSLIYNNAGTKIFQI
jgi:uncharacterized membrane protein